MNNDKLIKAAEEALDKFASAYKQEDTRTKSIRDRADEIINDIEDKYEIHVCNMTREELLDLSKALSRLAEFTE